MGSLAGAGLGLTSAGALGAFLSRRNPKLLAKILGSTPGERFRTSVGASGLSSALGGFTGQTISQNKRDKEFDL
jgi:hypothetical protein